MKTKANFQRITSEYLESRTYIKYPKAKWIIFCEALLDKGFTLSLYEARETNSKYIHIYKGKKYFKVRFSDHRPPYSKVITKDCDLFVGVSLMGVIRTEQALEEVEKFFSG